jgi:FkbM family methyltransferase
MAISRKQFLKNTGWVTSGAAFATLGRELVGPWRDADRSYSPPLSPPTVRPAPSPPPVPEARGDESFSQSGEDLIVNFMFTFLGITKVTYLDVGANHPTELSNTYYFYRKGYRGVLVEPNVALCQQLRAVRPGDTTLAAGIGVAAAREADYYVMNYPALNTFSKAEAEHQAEATKGRISVREVIKVPLLSINDVMAEHFKGAPTFLSIDTEGLDLAILKSLDFERFRPKVVCAETLVSSTTKTIPEIPEFMASRGYVDRGGSIVNTIFIDSKIL